MQLHDTHAGARISRARHIGKRLVATATVAALASVGIATAAQADPDTDITDPVLRACVEDALELDPGDVISETEVAALTSFTCNGGAAGQISSLEGIEHFTGLTFLSLQNHLLPDVEELSNLNAPGLVDLRLNGNRIDDLTPIAHMTGLTTLSFFNNNHVDDLEPIRAFDELTNLSFYGNSISDLDPIANKTQLTVLRAATNDLDQDSLDVVAGLSNLQLLTVNGWGLTDVTPLAGLTNLTWLNVSDNHISDLSPLSGLPLTTFYATGQSVELGTVAAGEPIANPVVDLSDSPVELDSLYDDVTNTFTPTVDDSSTSWEGDDPGGFFNYGYSGTLSFTAVDAITIPDAAFRACINDELVQDPDAIISVDQANSLTELSCVYDSSGPQPRISNLDGIENFPNLEELWLPSQRLDQDEANKLSALENLKYLSVVSNEFDDLSFVENMSALEQLDLNGNPIGDLAPVGELDSLRGLNAVDTGLTDLSPLAGLSTLNFLDVDNNHITDLSVLSGMNVGNVTAEGQTVDLGDIAVGSLEPNPVVGPDGSPVSLSDLYIWGSNAFSPDAEGPGTVTWDDGNGFTGELTFTGTPAVDFIDVPDSALLECLNQELGQGATAAITPAQAASITSLHCEDMGIEDLTGIETLANLSQFNAPDNAIVDVAPLAAVGGMGTGFNLSGNLIDDVTPLATMWVGEGIDLSDNRITDISPLGSMPGPAYVNAADQVVDLGEVTIGDAIANPVVDFNGDALALSAVYDPASNTFTATALGAGGTTWDGGETDAGVFSGTLMFTGVEAQVEEPPADPAQPAPEEPAEPAAELPQTGPSSPALPLSVSIALMLIGLGLVRSKRLQTLIG